MKMLTESVIDRSMDFLLSNFVTSENVEVKIQCEYSFCRVDCWLTHSISSSVMSGTASGTSSKVSSGASNGTPSRAIE